MWSFHNRDRHQSNTSVDITPCVWSGAAYLQFFELIADGEPSLADAFLTFFEGGARLLEETDFIDPCPIGTVAREVASVNEPSGS